MDLFIFAAEPSADLHGEKLLKALLEKNPYLKIEGVGGPKMRATGLKCIMPMENFQVMGFIDVIKHLPQLIKHFYTLRAYILKAHPQAVLFIDYPGFNLKMEEHLRKKGYKGKLIHYICPSIWAWGKKRIFTLEKNLDLLLSILPFEKDLFKNLKLAVEYVGNPLVQRIQEYQYKPFDFPKDKKIIAVFPGSRRKEIERNFPLQLKVLKQFPDYALCVSIANSRFLPLIKELLQKEEVRAHLIPGEYTYELMKVAYIAVAKSGTVTLELGLHATPSIVTYAISFLDMLAVKYFFKPDLPFYSLVNILCKKEVFPELMGPKFTEKNLYEAVKNLLAGTFQVKEECEHLKQILTTKKASEEAASHILNSL